jgi:hypothetical protein
MSSIINATASSGLTITPDSSGQIQFQLNGNNSLSLTSTGVSGVIYSANNGIATPSTSGTFIDFTGIPSWVKRITVMFNQVSTSGSTSIQVQIGSGSVATTGYASVCSTYLASQVTSTTGMCITSNAAPGNNYSGQAIICLSGSNFWTFSSNITRDDLNTGFIGSAYKSLSGTLDRVRITTFGGSDTFDAGSISLFYEG